MKASFGGPGCCLGRELHGIQLIGSFPKEVIDRLERVLMENWQHATIELHIVNRLRALYFSRVFLWLVYGCG